MILKAPAGPPPRCGHQLISTSTDNGNGSSSRSGCMVAVLPDGRILVYDAYSKSKKDVDKGTVHSDVFILGPDKPDTTGTKWKWIQIKAAEMTVLPQSGLTLATTPAGKAYMSGGVLDNEKEPAAETT